MWLVLCEQGDGAAAWAADELGRRGLSPCEVVTPEQLAYARRWEHRVSSAGASTELVLADGREVPGLAVRGVLNRLGVPFGPELGLASTADRDYARQEMTALVASWLYGLPCPVLNRPAGHSVSGPWLHLAEWRALAVRAGLPVVPYTGDEAEAAQPDQQESVFVLGDAVVGAGPEVADGCRRLGALAARGGLVGLTFLQGAFVAGSPLADLREGGQPLADALAAALSAR